MYIVLFIDSFNKYSVTAMYQAFGDALANKPSPDSLPLWNVYANRGGKTIIYKHKN